MADALSLSSSSPEGKLSSCSTCLVSFLAILSKSLSSLSLFESSWGSVGDCLIPGSSADSWDCCG